MVIRKPSIPVRLAPSVLNPGVLRITVQRDSNAVVLKLEGRVTGPWVEELRRAWISSTKVADGELIEVELSGVSFVDAKGRDLLLRMQREKVDLKGASGFLRQLLKDGNEKVKQSSRDAKIRRVQ